ncbi:MAG: OmpA family protein [Pseudomonadota bacterium]
MPRKAAWEDLADSDLGPYGKSRGTRWGRVFAGLLFVSGATFVAAYYLPLYRAHQKLAEQYRELGQRSQALSETVNKAQSELKTATESRDQLQAERDSRESAKKSTGEQQERVRVALSAKLDKFVKKGNAALLVSAGSLFVAFDSALLFLPQKLELTPTGRTLLCDVAKTSEAKALTVRASLAGSAVPPALAISYPNAWALSAGRAAAVAQALEQACSFPAAQLSATGNGSQQPLAGLKLTGDPIELEVGLGAH